MHLEPGYCICFLIGWTANWNSIEIYNFGYDYGLG